MNNIERNAIWIIICLIVMCITILIVETKTINHINNQWEKIVFKWITKDKSVKKGK